MRFEALLDRNKVKLVNFQYHLNCQDIHDNTGANWFGRKKMKSHHVNRRYLKLSWIVRKRS